LNAMGFYGSMYETLFTVNADQRVAEWPLMKDPLTILTIIAAYLYAIYYYLPKHMEKRKPYDIKFIIQTYNVFQVFACTYIVHGLCVNGWFRHYTLGCQLVDYSDDPYEVNILNIVFWTLLLKMTELFETCFFVLRGKQNQVSKLHVYHHCSTLLFAWTTTKYMGGGMATFAIVLNCIVHIIMYSYYFLSALGSGIQKKISWVKPKITMMQMVQFWILLFHTLQVYHPDCKMPNLAGFVFLPNLLVLFVFFLNFYLKSYRSKRVVKTN